jgi:hypothetical protein
VVEDSSDHYCGWEEVKDACHTMELLNDTIGGHYPHWRRRIGGDGGGGTVYRRWGKPIVLAAHSGSAGKVCTGSIRGGGSTHTGWRSWIGQRGGCRRARWAAIVAAKREGRISKWCLNRVERSMPLRGERGEHRAGLEMTAAEGAATLRRASCGIEEQGRPWCGRDAHAAWDKGRRGLTGGPRWRWATAEEVG